jgi:hypothetical protein
LRTNAQIDILSAQGLGKGIGCSAQQLLLFQEAFPVDYPGWTLSAVLWARFFLIAARLLPSELEKISDVRARESHEGWNESATGESGAPLA